MNLCWRTAKARIGCPRTWWLEPELAVADEPVSRFDVSIQAQVINCWKTWAPTLEPDDAVHRQ
jgi:ABC-type oligopeptide transport system ATPase subunit